MSFLSLRSRTDPRGITTNYSYGAAGRTTRLGYSDGTYAAFSYDASGNLTKSANANVTNNYTSYDGNDRVTASNVQVAGPTYNFSYTYDLAGDLTSETYPSGRVLNTTFDVGTRPATVTSQGASTAYVQQAGYWPSGAGYYWQYGNTVWPVEGYSAQLTPWYTSATLNNNGNYYLLALGTTWNANNTVQQTAEGFGPPGGYYGLTFLYQNYNYDRLNRLQAVVDTNYSRGFNYDEFGNMSLSEYGTVMPITLAPLSGGGRANPYDPGTNRLLGTTFGYDTRGDLTTMGAMTITYDAEANVIGTADSVNEQPVSISYTFDAEGQRVEKQTSGGATIIDVRLEAVGKPAANCFTGACYALGQGWVP